MWDLPGPGLEPVSPSLADGFLTTAPPGKSLTYVIIVLVLYYCLSTKENSKGPLFKTDTHISLSLSLSHTHTHTHTLCCQLFSNPWTHFCQWSLGSTMLEWVLLAFTRNSFWKGRLILSFHIWSTHSRYTLKNKPINFCVSKATRQCASSKVWLGSQVRIRNQKHNVTSSCCWLLALCIPNGRTRAWKQK